MPVVADIEISAEDFILGQVLRNTEEYYVELTQFVPTNSQFMPYVWIESDHLLSIESSFRCHPRVAGITKYDERAGRALYEIEWTQPLDDFLKILMDVDCLVAEGSGTPENWVFELLASHPGDLAALQSACQEEGISIDVRTIIRSDVTSDTPTALTDKQRQILKLAYDRGYFGVPREVTVTKLAEELRISPQAASKRLRRSLENVVGDVLRED